MLDADLAHLGLDPAWTTFGDYLDEVERQPLGPNVALLVGHGTVRWAAMGPEAARRRRTSWPRWAATSRRRSTPARSGCRAG